MTNLEKALGLITFENITPPVRDFVNSYEWQKEVICMQSPLCLSGMNREFLRKTKAEITEDLKMFVSRIKEPKDLLLIVPCRIYLELREKLSAINLVKLGISVVYVSEKLIGSGTGGTDVLLITDSKFRKENSIVMYGA